MSRTRQQLEDWLKTLNLKASRVFDVGGSQLPIIERLGSLKCDEYLIFDLPAPHEVKRPTDIPYDINVEQGLCALPADLVFCLEVMEYVSDPVTACRNLANLLKKDGRLYISFPFIYPHHNPVREDMLRYTEFGARRLLENAGFQIDDVVYRKADPENITEFFRQEGMKPSRDYFKHDSTNFNFICTKK